MPATTRFAPSPTGLLHLGHVHAALFAWRRARSVGGRFLLRLEDIDPTRCREEYAQAIADDLGWLGIAWGGPVRRQSRHLPEFAATLGRLGEMGVLYPCFCTRADIRREVEGAVAAPHAPDGSRVYGGACRALSPAEREKRVAAGQPYALRLDTARALDRVGADLSFEEEGEGRLACHPRRFGDVILARKEVPASYHLCVVHDDALQGVTLVTRGVDLKPATDLHRLLQALLGLPEPAYAHHALLTDPSGRRLAKRAGSTTVRSLRAAGLAPAQVRAMAGFPE